MCYNESIFQLEGIMKKVLTVLLIIVILGALIGGFFIYRHASSTIGKNAAVEIALKDAEVNRANAYDIDADYEHGWYEVNFETASGEYEYRIDAKTGEILSRYMD